MCFPSKALSAAVVSCYHDSRKYAILSPVEYLNAVRQKNAISIFGTPLRWQHEFKWINDYKDHLCKLIKDGYIDKSIISHILQIGENVTFVDGKVNPIRYIWLAAYDLSRMAKNKGDIGKGFIKQCVLDIMSGRTLDGKQINSPYHALQLIIIAARLAEMTQWKTN